MLQPCFSAGLIEAGCDEAGRGCLAGPVFAAAVIFPKDFRNEELDDSKKLTRLQRDRLRPLIEESAISWAVAKIDPEEIDRINILNASLRAMHHAVRMLGVRPQLLLIDGNRFHPFENIPHHCIIQGDGKFMAIAAASVLAKTYRDAYMESLHADFPCYGWISNKGYPSREHREALKENGKCIHHRMSFNLFGDPEEKDLLL
ncbi:MAG TPA: ribonuclease HII [Bacteroidales bacterium]|nr:ribonuclease HII [Bacteroidales bacterium]